MIFKREVILHCFQGEGISCIEIFTKKIGSSGGRIKIAECPSPVTLSDVAGLKIKIHGDGRIRKYKKAFRKLQEEIEKNNQYGV